MVALLGQIVGAQMEVERAIAELSRLGIDASELTAQLGSLADLRHSITTADPSALLALRGEIGRAVTGTQAALEQGKQLATGRSSEAADLAERQAEARAKVEMLFSDYYEKRVLDPYLRFSNPEEEEAYRQREREREAEIRRERARGTADGDHRAAQLMEAQLLDAGQHGANASPDFPAMLQTAKEARAATEPAPANQQAANAPAAQPAAGDELSEVMAALKTAGVQTQQSGSGHGLAENLRTASVETSQVRA